MSDIVPSLPEVIRAALSNARRTMFGGWLPGRIETYDSVKCKASVQLLIEEVKESEGGKRTTKPYPIINDVPVQTLGDGFGMRIELALAKGDYVTVLFAARSIDRWLPHGGMVDPGDERDHDLNDAVAIPGLFDFGHVKHPTAKIKFTQTQVQIGGTHALVTKEEFDGHTHGPGTFSNSGGSLAGLSGGAASVSGTQVLKGG